ncbi:hypothetical protein K7432_016170 [Basidiobolus ranarum]|uniref:Uncharacterized protein n=1 Tax=Basidiobolus ranarum TaxID=34480 RepID=A0ABR2WF47_9FUNG
MLPIAIASLLVRTTSNVFPANNLIDPNYGPISGKSSTYSTYDGVTAPFLVNSTEPILPTSNGMTFFFKIS